MNKGRIIKIISNLYTVLVDNQEIDCRCRGGLRYKNLSPVVGDIVLVDVDKKYILEIEDRSNYLERPYIANIDACLIVTSLKEPDISLNLLDKQISYLTIHDIKPIIIFTKSDLCNEEELQNSKYLKEYYEKIGIDVFCNTELDEIKSYLKKMFVALTGQSGAGKSTLINKLGDYNILTNEISHALGRGRHTTRHVEIYDIGDIYIADTPGFSALDLDGISKLELRDSFTEFDTNECRFKDCLHHKENVCGVKDRVGVDILPSRYENYIKFLGDLK